MEPKMQLLHVREGKDVMRYIKWAQPSVYKNKQQAR
jgi:hypothetical protein